MFSDTDPSNGGTEVQDRGVVVQKVYDPFVDCKVLWSGPPVYDIIYEKIVIK